MLLDNRLGAVYFRPNGRTRERFRNPERIVVRSVVVAVVIGAAFVAFRRKR
jgi:hypothetical protein